MLTADFLAVHSIVTENARQRRIAALTERSKDPRRAAMRRLTANYDRHQDFLDELIQKRYELEEDTLEYVEGLELGEEYCPDIDEIVDRKLLTYITQILANETEAYYVFKQVQRRFHEQP
jgi:uncharacterized protein YaaR (DUF327 family)